MVKEFILQWHLSEACNLKCLHCYQENHIPVQLSHSQLIGILQQYKDLLQSLNMKGHINLTGGEPLCCPYFFQILDEMKKDKDLYSFSILTNGTLITDDIAKKIAMYHPKYVQVSLEGGRKTNDFVRGKNVYKKVANAIKQLKKYDIYVSLSFTATKLNFKEFPKVVKFAEKYGVDTVWSDRYIPIQNDRILDLEMNQEETNDFLKLMQSERIRLKSTGKHTNIAMYRALQFQMTNDYPYACTAGESLLTIMENGDLVPCRRLPIVVGNLLKNSMIEIYRNSSALRDLRLNVIPDDCISCEHSRIMQRWTKVFDVCQIWRLKPQGHWMFS